MILRVIPLLVICQLVAAKGWWFVDRDNDNQGVKSPIVIVPGTGGSRLNAKLTGKPSTPAWYCKSKTSSYFTLWLQISSLLPYAINCWQDNMRLVYDTKTLTASNSPGVVTRVPGFGKTDTIETLDTHGFVKYMKPLIDFLVTLGYERNKNIRAAPYDFRYAPSQMPGNYYEKLQGLIESSYTGNGNTKVSLISHSYGCPISLYFLNMMTQAWKDKYLKQWITLSGVFGGTIKEVLLYGSGDTFGVPRAIVKPLTVRHEQRTATSNLAMLPSPQVWNGRDVIVQTSQRSYSVDQLDDYLRDVGFPEGVAMRHKVGDLYKLVKASGVKMHCYYGNIPKSTEEMLIYGEGDFPDTQPKIVKGSGDETVNLRSLKLCEDIGRLQTQAFKVHEIAGVNHNGILSNDELFQHLKDDLFS